MSGSTTVEMPACATGKSVADFRGAKGGRRGSASTGSDGSVPETCGRCGIGTSQNFAKALFQAVGLAPLEGDASGSWKRAARTALVVAFLLSLAAALSFTMYYLVSLAALWIPNSITIGYLIGTQWRERLLILPTSVVVGLAASLVMKASLAQALAQTLLNLAECLAVFFTTTLLASAFSKQLRTRVDLTKPLHLVAFGIGLLWTLIFAVPGAASVQFFMPDYIQVSFRTLFLNWLDLTPVCLIAPFVIAMLESPLNWASIRVRPYRIALLASLSLVLVATPVFTATVLPGRANSATIIGLYLTWPLVGVLSATSGLKGATFGLVLVGISCVIVTPFRPSSKTTCEYEDVETIRFNNMLWLQVCLLVESMSCLVFNLVLTKCEKARLSIECEVRIRTEQLEQAKARAEEANANKAAFISFLCHELRNPLHAVSNLTDLLLEQRANGETEPLKWDASSIVGVQPAVQPITRPGTPLPPSKDASCAWTRAVDTTALVSDPGSDPVTAVSLCTNYMLALLSDTLDVFKFESGAVRLEKTPTDLQQLFAEISAMASPRAASKGLVFRLEMATDVPKFGEVDPLRLQQVVNNLLSNSFKFTPRGGTVKLVVELVPPAAPPLVDQSPDPASIISIEPCDSSLRNSSQDTSHESFITVPMTPVRRDTLGPQHGSNFRLRIRCSDSGIGIPHESLATLFDPWTQATSSTSAEYGGSGLGLSIAAQIVELFGGEIWAESELGAGTTFIMELPVVARRPEGSMVTRSARARSFSQRFATPSRRTASLASIHFDNDRAPTPIGKEPPAITPAIHQHLEPQSASSTATLDDETDPFPRARRLLTATDYLLDSEPPPDPVLPRTRRILVTDDSAINRKILVRMLSQCLKRFFAGERFIVDEAENGLEAVELVTKDAEEGNNEIELIFMDVVMPVMDGYQAVRTICKIPGANPRIIMASANQLERPDGGGNPEWLQAGADDALGKPFGRADVERLLKKYCISSKGKENDFL